MKQSYRVRVPPELASVIVSLAPERKRRLRMALRYIEKYPLAGKQLQRELAGYCSYKAKPYRIVYRLEGKVVRVYAIGHRREVYEVLAQRLTASASARRA